MTNTCTYEADGGTLFIEFDYSPAERQTWDEPGCAESADIVSVTTGGVELLDLLSDATIALFEEKALEAMRQGREDAAYDRACERAEERAYAMECAA
jgi:hypothetical protein